MQDQTVPQTREIKARYLTAGMTLVVGDRPYVLSIEPRREGDVVYVRAAGMHGEIAYLAEEGVTVVGDSTEPVNPGRAALADVMAGIEAGLPIPTDIRMPDHYKHLNLKMASNNQAAVDAWVAHFDLSAPKLSSVMTGPHRPFQSYESTGRGWPAADWSYEVESFVDVPEPVDPEKAALEAKVAELEAQLAQGGGAR